MAARRPGKKRAASWSLEDIPYHALAPGAAGVDRRLFYLVASASFIEITSGLYTRNLVDYFRCDSEVVEWLEREWESEELRHGAALKRYVRAAWPDFDWEGAYRTFLAEYTPLCTVEQLAGTRTLEMAARCVVETGTAAFYRMLSEASEEPVLSGLAARISADEVGHYKHFYRYFLRYQALECPGRAAVLRTLWSRLAAVDTEDAFCAFKAVFLACNPDRAFRRGDYDIWRADVLQFAKRHLPHDMAIKMLLKPLGLQPWIARAVMPVMASATRSLLMR
ncbi:ferritin-like domain-containing protein [Enhydrobacter sp.]|uniref:ferritin-like domain-containing protein n=1 Tax=Enhydrobacter sp. TaxID=1894999 RepID=UPI00261C0620|nr:ferritin-like domain-containing protein [Enhydrobacter sp.]WIM09291.1 MAG: hypothetical protein OJF58_000242 [Enhydrobacter sp.]